jgi:putative membrane protein
VTAASPAPSSPAPARRWRRWRPPSVVLVAGVAAALVAVSPPAEALAARGAAPHMVQHLVLTLVAGPALAAAVVALPVVRHRASPRAAGLAVAGGVVHAATLVAWHVPGPYDAAARNVPLHAAEHLTLLGGAIALWAGAALAARPAPGAAVAGLFVAAASGAGIGALLTFVPRPVYELSAGAPDPLADQQIAGLVMWVPGSLAYVAGLGAVLVTALTRPPAERSAAGPAPAVAGEATP